jgi:hypothetical protein
VTCEHLTDNRCKLGLYGGNPHRINCIACVTQGQNTPEFAAELRDTWARSHPEGVPKVSGCCDDARQFDSAG